MTKRESTAPQAEVDDAAKLPLRRADIRREVSERVIFELDSGQTLEGWALNVSRGGVRAIFEASVELGEELRVSIGEGEGSLVRRGRVVWKQDEPDGTILGVEFYRTSVAIKSVSHPPVVPASDPPPKEPS